MSFGRLQEIGRLKRLRSLLLSREMIFFHSWLPYLWVSTCSTSCDLGPEVVYLPEELQDRAWPSAFWKVGIQRVFHSWGVWINVSHLI